MKITIVSFVMTAAFGLIACDNTKHNTLTEQEKAEGWELLFDGETLDGWRDYNGTALTGPWEVVNGTIQADGQGSDASGYIVTDKAYENFEADKSARCIFTACACTVSAWECIILCFVFPCPTRNWTILWKFMSIAR